VLGVLGMVASGFALLAVRAHRARKAAEHAALTDPLTGLANRPAFDHRLAIEWERATRYRRPLGFVMLDLDGFKEVNDTRGHAAGDEIMRQVGTNLAQRVRGPDLAARIGGDEFAVLALETSGPGLATLAEDLRRVIEELPIGVSVGWAERTDGDPGAAAMLSRADEAMYKDKELRIRAQGRASVTAPTVAAGA
jgi:diguanylate cyclase (GGDEF)-like protein